VSPGNFENPRTILWCIQANFEPYFQALIHVNMLKTFVVKLVKIGMAHNSDYTYIISCLSYKFAEIKRTKINKLKVEI